MKNSMFRKSKHTKTKASKASKYASKFAKKSKLPACNNGKVIVAKRSDPIPIPSSKPTSSNNTTNTNNPVLSGAGHSFFTGRSPPVRMWVNDNSVTNCYECKTSFGWMMRKHHCRLCGRIFCAACSNNQTVIPSRFWSVMPESPPSFIVDLLNWKSKRSKPRRVCVRCNNDIMEHRRCDTYIRVLGIVMSQGYQIDDECMQKLHKTGGEWAKAAEFYMKQFHKLVRSRIPGDHTDLHKHSTQHLLTANAGLICQRYPHLIPAVCSHINGCNTVTLLLSKPQSLPSMHVSAAYDVVDGYRGGGRRKIMNDECLDVLKKLKQKASKQLTTKKSYMEFFLTRLVFCKSIQTIESVLRTMNRLCLDRMYWVARVYRPRVAELILESNPSMAPTIRESVRLLELFEDLAQPGTTLDTRRKLVREWKSKTKNTKVYLPGMFPTEIKTIVFGKIAAKKSSTTPMIIPCVCYKEGTNRKGTEIMDLLYKPEGVLNDVVMMDCLGYIHDTLEQSETCRDWAVNIVWYSVVPATKRSGVIAMVPKSRTLQGITHNKMTLLNYLLEHNSQSNVHDLRVNFLHSCTICSVQSMIFGLGDRHLENILLTEGGCMFHVDYSYLFGKEPHVKTLVSGGYGQQMKLTPSIVNVMGGQKSKYFTMFRNQTQAIFNLVRSHCNALSCICEPLAAEGYISKDNLLKHFYKTLRPGEDVQTTNIQIENIINYNTKHRMMDGLLDTLHSTYTMFF